ncbi:MAG: class I SAM-dependent methyltransferase [Pseudomonadota bacterium]
MKPERAIEGVEAPLLRPEEPPETADAAAATDEYALRFAGATGAWMLSVQTDAILRMLAGAEARTVLDVGGGHAQITPPVLAAGYRVTGLVSRHSSLIRLRNAVGDDPAHTLLEGDLMALPFPDRSFDAVVSVRAMAHVRSWPAFVSELCRVSRGSVIVDFASADGVGKVGRKLFGLKRAVERSTRPYTIIPPAEVASAFAREGFDVTATVGQFVLPLVCHRILRRPRISAALERALRPVAGAFGNPVILNATRRGAAPP